MHDLARITTQQVPDINILSREEYLSAIPIEDPTTIEQAFQEYFRILAAIDNVVGFGFTAYLDRMAIAAYQRSPISGMTSEQAMDFIHADDLLHGKIRDITGHEIQTTDYFVGDASFEEIVTIEHRKKPLTEEQQIALREGRTPEGMTDEETEARFFENLLGLTDTPVEEPVYFKFG